MGLLRRWNSTLNNKDDDTKASAVTKPVQETLVNEKPLVSKNPLDIAIKDNNDESNQRKEHEDIEVKINNSTKIEKEQSDITKESNDEGILPWDNNNTNHNNDDDGQIDKNEINEISQTDPSKSELILAPMKKKSSPIQRLTPRKSLLSNNTENTNFNFKIERDYKSLMQFKYTVSNDDFINIIEELKPTNSVITVKQLLELSLNLDKSFKLKQIREYIERSCPDITLKKSMSKKKLINLIISEHWRLKVTLDPTEDLLEETRIDLSNKRDLFLLLSNRGFLPQHWSLIGAQLSLGNSRKELVVRGSKNIVNFVQASWNDLLNNISTDTIDLTDVIKFYDKLGKKLDLQTLQKESGVYFDKVNIDNNSYVLSAIKNSAISNAKIEILKATEYRYGYNDTIIIKNLIDEAKKVNKDSLIKMEISDDTLPWYIKPENHFRYSVAKKRIRESLLSDDSMIVELLSDEVQNLKLEVEEAKEKFEYNFVQTEDATKLNNSNKEKLKDNQFFHIENDDSSSMNVKNPINILEKIDIKEFDKEINNCQFEDKDNKNKLMLDNVISVKFGKLLFEKGDKNLKNSYFSENLSEVVRNIGKLELLDKESRLFGATGGIMNRFNKQIYVKLIPNGFWGNKFEQLMNYPSIEILFDLKDGKLEVNKFTSFLSEFEKNIEVSLPELEIDLKFQNSFNSMFIYNKDQWLLNGYKEEDFRGNDITEQENTNTNNENDDNDILMNKRLINMFISQISKRQFDIRRNVGLVGILNQFKYKPYSFYFPTSNNKKKFEMIKYCPIKVEFVQSIELEYKGLPVSFELRDDGENEKVEISMLKEGVNMEEFVQHSADLANFLCQ